MATPIAPQTPSRRPNTPRTPYPHALEQTYQQRLLPIPEETHERLLAIAEREFGSTRADAEEDLEEDLDELTVAMTGIAMDIFREVERAVPQAVAEDTAETIADQVQTVLGVNPLIRNDTLRQYVDEWQMRNSELITSIPEKHIGRARDILRRGFEEGLSYDVIAEELERAFEITENRALLIARNEVSTLHGQLTRQRQLDAGIRYYIWSDSNDARVREKHANLDGTRRSWDESPRPGSEINCRCTATPDFNSADVNIFAGTDEEFEMQLGAAVLDAA